MVIVYLNRDCLYSIIHCMLWQMVPRDSFFKLGKEFISFGSEVIILLSFILMEGTQEESLYDFEFGWLEGDSIYPIVTYFIIIFVLKFKNLMFHLILFRAMISLLIKLHFTKDKLVKVYQLCLSNIF